MQGDVAYLVEEERAAVGLLEFSGVVGFRVGEGSLDMSEQFAFEEGFGDGPEIHGDHRAGAAGGQTVYLCGEKVLPGTVLSGYQYSRVGGGYAFGKLPDG